MYCINEINKMKKINEQFTTSLSTTDDAIKTAVKQIYLADVEAIRILSNFAIQLTQGGTIVPGNVTFNENITISGSLKTNTISPSSSSIVNINDTTAVNINGVLSCKNSVTAVNINPNACAITFNHGEGENIMPQTQTNRWVIRADNPTRLDFEGWKDNTWDRNPILSINQNNSINCAGILKSNTITSLSGGIININNIMTLNSNPLNNDDNVYMNGGLKIKSTFRLQPTCVRIDPNFSAITFNHGCNSTNIWQMNANSSTINNLSFCRWDPNTTTKWIEAFSINQDNSITASKITGNTEFKGSALLNESTGNQVFFNNVDGEVNRWLINVYPSVTGFQANVIYFRGWNNIGGGWSPDLFSIHHSLDANGNSTATTMVKDNLIVYGVNSSSTINSTSINTPRYEIKSSTRLLNTPSSQTSTKSSYTVYGRYDGTDVSTNGKLHFSCNLNEYIGYSITVVVAIKTATRKEGRVEKFVGTIGSSYPERISGTGNNITINCEYTNTSTKDTIEIKTNDTNVTSIAATVTFY